LLQRFLGKVTDSCSASGIEYAQPGVQLPIISWIGIKFRAICAFFPLISVSQCEAIAPTSFPVKPQPAQSPPHDAERSVVPPHGRHTSPKIRQVCSVSNASQVVPAQDSPEISPGFCLSTMQISRMLLPRIGSTGEPSDPQSSGEKFSVAGN